MEKYQDLTRQLEILKSDNADLQEKYDYEKHELQAMIEELRDQVITLESTKQVNIGKYILPLPFVHYISSLIYLELSQENASIEDKLRTDFEFELKHKVDALRQILEDDYHQKILFYKESHERLEQDYHTLKLKYDQDLEQQAKNFNQEIDAMKIKHEKQIVELNNELDLLKTNGEFY